MFSSTCFLGYLLVVSLLYGARLADSSLESRGLAKRAAYILTDLKYHESSEVYYVTMSIGGGTKAPQTVRMAISSESVTWVAGPPPSSSYCDTGLTGDKLYYCTNTAFSLNFDGSVSSTFSNSSNYTQDLSGDVAGVVGYYAEDQFNLCQTEIEDFTFGIASNATVLPALGLGIRAYNDLDSSPSILNAMFNQKLIGVMAYGLFLNDFNADSGAQLSIGAIDTTKYEGSLATFDTAPPSLVTTLPMNGMSIVDNKGVPTPLLGAVFVNIEFGSYAIFLPTTSFNLAISMLGCFKDAIYDAYVCPCHNRWSNFSMSFAFDGATINVDAHQLIIPALSLSGDPYPAPPQAQSCTVLLSERVSNGQDAFSVRLGVPFVRGAYIVHDFTNNQTSLAAAVLNYTGGATIVPLSVKGVRDTPNLNVTIGGTNSTDSGSNSTVTVGGTNSTGSGSNSTMTEAPNPTPSKKSIMGAIVGGIVGGLAVIAIILGVLLILYRRTANIAHGMPMPVPPNIYSESGYEMTKHATELQDNSPNNNSSTGALIGGFSGRPSELDSFAINIVTEGTK